MVLLRLLRLLRRPRSEPRRRLAAAAAAQRQQRPLRLLLPCLGRPRRGGGGGSCGRRSLLLAVLLLLLYEDNGGDGRTQWDLAVFHRHCLSSSDVGGSRVVLSWSREGMVMVLVMPCTEKCLESASEGAAVGGCTLVRAFTARTVVFLQHFRWEQQCSSTHQIPIIILKHLKGPTDIVDVVGHC